MVPKVNKCRGNKMFTLLILDSSSMPQSPVVQSWSSVLLKQTLEVPAFSNNQGRQTNLCLDRSEQIANVE